MCRAMTYICFGMMISTIVFASLVVSGFYWFVSTMPSPSTLKNLDHDEIRLHLQNHLALIRKDSIGKWIIDNIPGMAAVARIADSLSTIVKVPLDMVMLPFKAIESIHQWFNGQISGRRCAKTVVDAVGVVAGGIGGAAAGAYVGAIGGLVGSVIGAVFGGFFGSAVADAIISNLTQNIFDLPRDVAVEMAYNFLRLTQSARNVDVNQAFRRLGRIYHPDAKYTGSQEKWMELQSNMQLIVEDRQRTFRM